MWCIPKYSMISHISENQHYDFLIQNGEEYHHNKFQFLDILCIEMGAANLLI